MDYTIEILKQVRRIVEESPWVTDDYGDTTCFFCSGEHPEHRDCPYLTLKSLQSVLPDTAALIEAGEVEGQ